ncbi:peptidoglycan-binding protein [Desulfovibrio mangrovi]|uniref:glycoside hydrolase family 108 protein n=1 Tax=Desulfovibrio mangrovi TaxID=2976983 RepID=UPI0022468A2A|nr:glycosyl hydrolase 108 family protein [Desulfovibrio mangrovi]UZP68438.1 peptidoglycan-binding protein [Desulfovibrio mangrovi]
MSDFDQEYVKLIGIEGGYVDDPDDAGGETYKGIARRYHAGWSGWSIIDAAKGKAGFPASLDVNEELDAACRDFYKREFWDRLACDKVPQDLAAELFEQAVNLPFSATVRYLQSACNALNDRQKYFPDLVIDGKLGPKTVEAMKTLTDKGRGQALVIGLNCYQGVRYMENALTDPVKRKYVRGWLEKRVGW